MVYCVVSRDFVGAIKYDRMIEFLGDNEAKEFVKWKSSFTPETQFEVLENPIEKRECAILGKMADCVTIKIHLP